MDPKACFAVLLSFLSSVVLPVQGMSPLAAKRSSHSLKSGPVTKGLHYAQSPIDFLNSKTNRDIQRDTKRGNIPNPARPYHGQQELNPYYARPLPYDKFPTKQVNARVPSPQNPSVSLYNQPGNSLQLSRPVPRHSGSPIQPTLNQPTNSHQRGQVHNLYPKPSRESSDRSTFPETSGAQNKLNFDLFVPKPNVPGPSSFGTGSQGKYFKTGGINNNAFINPHHLKGNSYHDSNNNHDFYRSMPLFSQGFSIPTTYQGRHNAPITSNEAFSTVTDPSRDKRLVIGSYVPANNFVNPTNFLIPPEDKYKMIGTIFGSFQRQDSPARQVKPKTLQPTVRPTEVRNPNFGSYISDRNYQNQNQRAPPNQANPNLLNAGGIYQNPNRGFNSQVPGQNLPRSPTFVASKSVAAPGFGQRFEKQGLFTYSPLESVNSLLNLNGNNGGKTQSQPALLFSDFSYDTPLSLNQFRSKNLAGDKDFGRTDYDKNRLTSDTLLDKKKNVIGTQGIYSPGSGRQSVTGNNNFQQVGGNTAENKNSYDNVYQTSRGYDNLFVDDGRKSTSRANPDVSESYNRNGAYDKAANFNDGDGYRKSYRFSDSGGDSDYNSQDESNQRGFKDSFEKEEDFTDSDSYNNAKGYSRSSFGGKNYDVSDGYTDNVKFNSDSNPKPNTSEDAYRQGVASVATALATKNAVQPFRGLPKSVAQGLPQQASHKPFDVNGPIMEN